MPILPHDLPSLPGHQVNSAYRVGDRFVKHVHRGGSPFAEVATGEGMRLLGLSNLHPEYAFEDGKHLVHAPFVEAKQLIRATPEDVKALRPDQIAGTLFGEWLHNVGDRHSGNYLLHNGVTSIDHGHALEPGATSLFNHPEAYTDPADEDAISTDPEESDLYNLARHHAGLRYEHRVPEKHLRAAFDNAHRLIDLAHKGTAGLPPATRDFAQRTMRARLQALATHLKHEKHLTVRQLILLHHYVKSLKIPVT